MNFLKDKSSK